ncbi:MAG: glycerophosphodiester phosphodiesterase family protein [Alphaproteobacteria bacterium]|nr:glycerophosphodiester phosphodiesterase family protein [Alphaproteobacteria bacterium]
MSEREKSWPTLSGEPPIVIAHRGASGYRPEHTLAAYELAIEMGADYIEPDLVLTRDGHLIARHDKYLSTTTDIAEHPGFEGRKKTVDGVDQADWFTDDFTLEEIRTLRAKQPFEGRSKAYDGQFQIPTFEEILDLARRKSQELGRPIGVYPETKAPAYYESEGLDFLPPLLEAIRDYGFDQEGSALYVQSFEPEILIRLMQEAPQIRRIQLVSAVDGEPNIGLDMLARWANGVGPHKGLLIDPETRQSTGFVEEAHGLGIEVHPWTFRNDQLPEDLSSPEDELRLFLSLGIDGLFTDFTDTAVKVIQNGPPK